MEKILTKDEVSTIEKIANRRTAIGFLIFTLGSLAVAVPIGLIWGEQYPILVFLMAIPMAVGMFVMTNTTHVCECQRCGSRFRSWREHTEDVCLCNLKTKLSKLDCK